MKYFLLSGFVLFCFKTIASLPEYNLAVLEARSSYTEGHFMPPLTIFTDSTPALNNNRDIAFPLSLINGQEVSGVWTKWDNKIDLSYHREDGLQISSFKMNDRKELVFTVYDDFYFYDLVETKNENGKMIFSSIKDQFHFQNISLIVKHNKGFSYKAINENKVIGSLSKIGDMNTYLSEGQDNHAYLFSPAFNQLGDSLTKVRLGEFRMWSEARPDIILFKNNKEEKLIAYDKDYDSSSHWVSFRNGVGLSDTGHMSFIGVDEEGKSHLVLFHDGVQKEIAVEGKDIKELSHFSPVVNNKGQVAFKALDKDGNTGIYIGDGDSIKRVVNQHDILNFNGRKFRVSYGEHIPFGGNIALNDKGDIIINTGLADESGTRDLGRGIIAFYTK